MCHPLQQLLKQSKLNRSRSSGQWSVVRHVKNANANSLKFMQNANAKSQDSESSLFISDCAAAVPFLRFLGRPSASTSRSPLSPSPYFPTTAANTKHSLSSKKTHLSLDTTNTKNKKNSECQLTCQMELYIYN